MPIGKHYFEEGLLVINHNNGALALHRDDGGVWQLDANAAIFKFVGHRVCIIGRRAGFDLLEVQRVELASAGTSFS